MVMLIRGEHVCLFFKWLDSMMNCKFVICVSVQCMTGVGVRGGDGGWGGGWK